VLVEPSIAAPVVYTAGYADRTIADFVEMLVAAGVQRIVDVRAVPFSRRKGFSKRGLAAALAERGIDYVHLPSAGNPYRDAKSDVALRRYAEHIDAHSDVIAELGAAIADRAAALLCLEKDPLQCHRSILARRLVERDLARSISHL
jgi:uncharacterized protein (DUF488 family)